MLALVFLLPAWVMLGMQARDRAVGDARRQAGAAVAVLAVTNDPALVEQALQEALGDAAGRTAIRGLAAPVGQGLASDEQISQTGTADGSTVDPRVRPAAVVPVPGGVSYFEVVPLPDRADGSDGGTAVVEVFVPEADLTRGVAARRWALFAAGALLLVGSLVLGDRLMSRSARAATGLATGARAFGGGEHEVRVEPAGPREIAEAGTAFNSMAERVSKQRAAERELIADLSHRLRTPLTALRLEAERVRASGSAGYRLAEAVEAMEREVDHLIHTARRPYEESAEPEPDHCDAGEVVRERMAFWSAVADDQSRPFRVYGAENPAPVPLPASELAAALDALLGNVFRYTPQGTAFEVALSRRAGYVALRIDDAGPGIASRERAIRRGTSGRGSTGLGLDIVRRAAIAGRGGVDIDRSALGGTSVVVLLADADPTPGAGRQLLGFVGRLKREPDERRWGRRARAARAHHGSP